MLQIGGLLIHQLQATCFGGPARAERAVDDAERLAR
jgi:hypothetical protein